MQKAHTFADPPIHHKTNGYYIGTHKLQITLTWIRKPLTQTKTQNNKCHSWKQLIFKHVCICKMFCALLWTSSSY